MNTPVLEAYGVRLEPIAGRHIAGFERIGLDPSIWRYMPLRIETGADVRAWAEESIRLNEQDRYMVWATCLASGEVVGSSRLFDLDFTHRTGEIGFTWLAELYRGTGVNPRAKLLQLRHAFETLHLRRIALKTHHRNLHSQRAMLKLGAVYEGTFRNHMLMPDGSTRHTAWYSITEEEWPTVRARLEQRIAAEPLPAV